MSDSPTALFETAVDALVRGDFPMLESALRDDKELVRRRSARAHRAMLLHYAGANGVEQFRQKTPANIVALTAVLLRAGADVDAVADMYGGSTTLSLAASSVHPQRAGVQIALLDLLLERGAAIDGVSGCQVPILAALRNGRGNAARFLAGRGASLNLESAAGTGSIDAVRHILAKGSFTAEERAAGLAWACEYGHGDVVRVLLSTGSDPNQPYAGQTPLHWAAMNAQAAIVELLLEHGAADGIRNQYGGTPLGQAQWSAAHDDHPERFEAVITLLSTGRPG